MHTPPTSPGPAWGHPACQDDDALLAQCGLNKSRSRGPGGQHRNKVETGVELDHTPTGVTAHATEHRSVSDNKRVALRRLRLALAVGVRAPVPEGEIGSALWRSRVRGAVREPAPNADPVLKALGVKLRSDEDRERGRGPGRIVVNPEHHDYPALLAEALDVIAAAGWDVKAAALRLGVSASQLVKLVKDHPAAFVRLNQERERIGAHPYK